MNMFIVNTGLASARSRVEIEADLDAYFLDAVETDFAFLLETSSSVYSYEKGAKTIISDNNWNSASKKLQAEAALYQIQKGVLSLTDTLTSVFAAYSAAFPGEGIPAYTGDATIQDALNFSTGYSTQSRNAGDPSGANIPQPKAWIKAVAGVPSGEVQSAPAGTDGSSVYSTGNQCQYGAAILAELIRTGATYTNSLGSVVPFLDWRDVWDDFITNEAPHLAGTQVGTTYFTSSDVIKKCSIVQYMDDLKLLDDASTSTAFLNKSIRDDYFTNNTSFLTYPMPGGVFDASWFNGIDSGWSGIGSWIRPLGDEDEGDVETSGLGGQFTKISRRDGFKFVFGPVLTGAVTQFPGGFTMYTRNSGELRALVREWAAA